MGYVTHCLTMSYVKTAITKLEGKLVEIVENIDIGKYFNVNTENQIAASLLEDLLKNAISQITIYVKTENKNIQNSYTIFIANKILKQDKITKGKNIKINIKYKINNKIKIWYSDRIIK